MFLSGELEVDESLLRNSELMLFFPLIIYMHFVLFFLFKLILNNLFINLM